MKDYHNYKTKKCTSYYSDRSSSSYERKCNQKYYSEDESDKRGKEYSYLKIIRDNPPSEDWFY